MTSDAPTAPRPRFGIGTVVVHEEHGRGRIVHYQDEGYVLLLKNGETKWVGFQATSLREVETAGAPELDLVKQALREILLDYGWLESDLEMSKRFLGGTLRLIPGQEGSQPKDVPLESFFKKIIAIRDKLRVLEQKLNSHPALSAEDKLDLQGHISRCYGSLTTFNVLFANKEGQFKGTGKEE